MLLLLRAWANYHGITAADTPVKHERNASLYILNELLLVPPSNERVISIDEVRDGVYQIALFQSRPGCVDKGMCGHLLQMRPIVVHARTFA